MPRRPRGFTLVELIITVVVVAILGAVALPSFLSQMRKGRRSDAVSALSLVQQAEEKWRSSNGSYTTSMSSLGVSSSSSANYYAISVSSASATGYIAVAEAVSGTSQAGDAGCTLLAVEMNGGTVRYGSASTGGTFASPIADTHGCWTH